MKRILKARLFPIFVVSIFALAVVLVSETGHANDKIWKERSDRKAYIDPAYNEQFVRLAKESIPAVVSVSTTKNIVFGPQRRNRNPYGNDRPFDDFFDFFFGPEQRRKFQSRGLGSGFIINPEGYIFTNNHVVEEADEILITLENGSEYEAKVVGTDPRTDMALIKIDAGEKLPYLPLGDSDALQVGETVVAIGNPLGLSHTVTRGIVSQKGRKDINPSGKHIHSNFIQTDASINPGNSGGPLLNIYGEVIGINTAVAQAQGIGFAIPINMAKTLLPQLVHGKVNRSWMGIQVQKVTSELAGSLGLDKARGALVTDVVKDGPAEKAGIEPEDIILEFDGRAIANWQDLVWYASTTGKGKKVELKIWRDRREIEKTLRLDSFPEDEYAENADTPKTNDKQTTVEAAGITVAKPNKAQLKKAGIEDGEGVVIVDLDPRQSGGRSGLRPGDIIRKINRKKIGDIKDFEKAMKRIDERSFVRLLINRQQSALFIAFQR